MGYVSVILEKVIEIIEKQLGKFKGIRMLELGDQKVWDYYNGYKIHKKYGYSEKNEYTKYFFEFLGIDFTSIDYSGLNGSLKLDLRENLPKILGKKYDIITNLGTIEHVGEDSTHDKLIDEQYKVFKNIHELGDTECIYFHVLPFTKNWHKHGACDYSLDFFKVLIEKCEYKIIIEPYIELYRKNDKEKLICTVFKKTKNNNFISINEFKKIPGLRTTFFD